MLRVSADVRRIRITGASDLEQIADAGQCQVDPWAISHGDGMYERLCRSLGAHMETSIDGMEPVPGDKDPSVLDRLLADIRDSGGELWAVTVTFNDAVHESLQEAAERARERVEITPRTRFLVLPASTPG